MEPLWSPVVATGGNQPQIDETRKPRKRAKSVATGCHRLLETFHGKEGVSGSSPEEGFAKYLQKQTLFLSDSAARFWAWASMESVVENPFGAVPDAGLRAGDLSHLSLLL
jgi:hypothetical protein